MIVSDYDKTNLEGSRIDLIYDFNAIVSVLLESAPEIVAITLAKRSEEIQRAFLDNPLSKNSKAVEMTDALIEGAINSLKGGEDE